MSRWDEGRKGESVIRDLLTKHRIHFMQADILAKPRGKWNIYEVKYQEIFTPPPFTGHGLPLWQIQARLKFQEDTGIRASLYVVDKATGIIYYQYMDELMNGESYQTNGNNPRIIFPIDNYKVQDNK